MWLGIIQRLPYELEKTGFVWNVADNGFVMRIVGEEETSYYFVSREALADGLQEADLIYIYTQKMDLSS